MRAFLGIGLTPRVRETLVSCREAGIAADTSWRSEKWVAPENLHVTVRFLGDLDDETVARVAARLEPALIRTGSYRLHLDGVAVVPRIRAASLIWVEGEEGSSETANLASLVETTLQGLVAPSERRRFKTHATLCRARHPRRISTDALDAIEHTLHRVDERARSMSVRRVTLYSSVLTPAGPVYEEIASFGLDG
jgi:2'-5' RNA ligase